MSSIERDEMHAENIGVCRNQSEFLLCMAVEEFNDASVGTAYSRCLWSYENTLQTLIFTEQKFCCARVCPQPKSFFSHISLAKLQRREHKRHESVCVCVCMRNIPANMTPCKNPEV